MKITSLFFLLSIFSLNAHSQTDNLNYDKALTYSLGGDDYGMKPYVLVILKAGLNKIDDKKIVDGLFNGHIANIVRLASENKLVVSGPLMKDDKSYEGIFILNVKTKNEANALLATGPAIKEKLLDTELYQSYGSAALPAYLTFHYKIEKRKM